MQAGNSNLNCADRKKQLQLIVTINKERAIVDIKMSELLSPPTERTMVIYEYHAS